MSALPASLPSRVLIELCVDSVRAVEIASQSGGADRIELNAAYELGGLTPSIGALIESREMTKLPIIAMLRPRAGGFCYDDADVRVMHRDAELLLGEGADGLAVGFLKEDRTIDLVRCRDLIRLAKGKPVVFHRAFDETPDAFVAMEQLIDLGFRRILTSGKQPTAMAGADLLANLNDKAAGRIEVLPGAGIRAKNVAGLIARTGCTQVHTSLRATRSGDPSEAAACAELSERKLLEFIEAATLSGHSSPR